MKLAQFSVFRPIFTTMVTLIIVILGGVSLIRLQIDLLPNIELPTLSVRTDYEGASPEVMERLVTQIIEEIVATVPGVEEITSQSSEGNSSVRVTFVWGTDIDTAALDVQSRLEDEINELPDDVVRPRIRKFDISSFPVVLLGITSTLDPVELTQFIEDHIRYRFVRIPGVAQVDLWGGFEREVRIELDHDRLKALAVPLDAVMQSIQNANLDLPAGKIDEGRYEVMLRAPAEFTSLDQILNTVIVTRNGAPVTIGQIADVKDTYQKLTRAIRVNGSRGVRVAIRKQANANTVEVAKGILEEIDAVNSLFPQIKIVPVINQGNFIERSIANVARSVLYGGGLAILILLFFLRNLQSTFVISLAIPISIVATIAMIFLGGFTLNLMTLGGLALGVGMMVDNSIVVLENIFRRRDEEKDQPFEAAISGTTEVGPAIIASTITTLVIFFPLVFVRGVSGILFQELGYVVIFSLLCSLMVSLSLVPMLASRLVRSNGPKGAESEQHLGIFFQMSERLFTALNASYITLLGRALDHRFVTILVAAFFLGSSLLLLPHIGSEFLPPSDEGEVRITGKMEVGTRLEIIDEQTKKIEKIIYPLIPELVSSVVSINSTSGGRGDVSQGEIRLSLTPSSQRKRSNTQIADDLRRHLDKNIPGMDIRLRAPQGQFLLERLLGGDEGLKIEVRGFDLDTLDLLAHRVVETISDLPGITDVDISREAGMPQQEILVNREKIADLGLTVRDVTEVLETAVAGSRVGDYRKEGNSCRILVQLKDVETFSIEKILDLTLSTPRGDQVALRNVVETRSSSGPILIDRKDQQRLVTVTANVVDRDMGSIARVIQDRLATIPLPIGYDIIIAGNFEEQQKAFHELLLALVLALILVYMVMACQYESLLNPLVVMFSVPLAAIGVLLALFLTGTTLNVQSYIGCIMLGGIVVNNAILLVDQTGQLQRKGLKLRESLLEAGRRRLRPILMTTSTTILGLLPLAMGIGEGADAQAPLARAVIGGLTSSTLITLILIPVIYSLLHRRRNTA